MPDAAEAVRAELRDFCLGARAAGWRVSVARPAAGSVAAASWPIGAHVHDGWEVKVVLRGSLAQWLPDGEVRLRAPAVLLVPPGTVHGSSRPQDLRDGDALLCWTDDPRTGALWFAAGRRSATSEKLPLRAEVLAGEVGCAPAETLERVAAGVGDPDPLAAMRSESLLAVLLIALSAVGAPPTPARRRLVQRADAIIRERSYDPDLGVESIARELGCTARHLRQRYRDAGRPGVRQALIATRLGAARRLLAGGRSVKEVSRLTGWRSQAHFSRSYAARYGVPPSSR